MKPVCCAYITNYTATFTWLHQIPRQRYPATIQGYRCLTYLAMWIRIRSQAFLCEVFKFLFNVYGTLCILRTYQSLPAILFNFKIPIRVFFSKISFNGLDPELFERSDMDPQCSMLLCISKCLGHPFIVFSFGVVSPCWRRLSLTADRSSL